MKITSEAKMLIVMGVIVAVGGGFLLMSGDGSMFDKPNQPGATKPAPVVIKKEDFDSVLKLAPTKGPDDARFTVIEFADFQCPLCRKMFAAVCKDLGKKVTVKFGFVHYPIEEIHQYSLQAALTGDAAREQGKFWEYYDAMFTDTDPAWNDALVDERAKIAGMNFATTKSYIQSEENIKKIQALRDRVSGLGVQSTPSFWVLDNQTGKISQVVGVELYKALAEAPGMPKIDATQFATPGQ
jgi:protein-disulfide isomerase